MMDLWSAMVDQCWAGMGPCWVNDRTLWIMMDPWWGRIQHRIKSDLAWSNRTSNLMNPCRIRSYIIWIRLDGMWGRVGSGRARYHIGSDRIGSDDDREGVWMSGHGSATSPLPEFSEKRRVVFTFNRFYTTNRVGNLFPVGFLILMKTTCGAFCHLGVNAWWSSSSIDFVQKTVGEKFSQRVHK